jgi:hypothetical protein
MDMAKVWSVREGITAGDERVTIIVQQRQLHEVVALLLEDRQRSKLMWDVLKYVLIVLAAYRVGYLIAAYQLLQF